MIGEKSPFHQLLSILAIDQPARLPEVRAAFVSVDRIQARHLSFGGCLRGQDFNHRKGVRGVRLVERLVDPNNRVHMPVLGMGSVGGTLHSVSLGERRGEDQVGEKSP
jgi:hypothetical protein